MYDAHDDDSDLTLENGAGEEHTDDDSLGCKL